MSKEIKLIPELRFPEFKKDGEWERKRLNKVLAVRNEQAPKSEEYPLMAFIKDIGVAPKGDRYNREFLVNDGDGKKYKKTEYGDFIYSSNNLDTGSIGLNLYGPASISPIYSIFQTKQLIDFQFIGKLLVRKSFINKMLRCRQGVVYGQWKIHESDFLQIEVAIPRIEEQQKIAACLSSLDELISAHNEKLAALKNHKKGLMQNLFPQEGQKVPNYRFPEFEDDGEWELKPFSKFIKLYRGSSPRPIKEYITQSKSGVNWIKIGDTSKIIDFVIRKVTERITLKGAEKSRYVHKGELILANSMSYGSTYLLDVEGCIYDGWFVLREYEEFFEQQFLLQLLNSEYTQSQYKKYAAGGIVQNISSEIVYSITLPKTSKKEQQKIASCLTALDELIFAQAEKIEELQRHKKGLMQGLFPKIEN